MFSHTYRYSHIHSHIMTQSAYLLLINQKIDFDSLLHLSMSTTETLRDKSLHLHIRDVFES